MYKKILNENEMRVGNVNVSITKTTVGWSIKLNWNAHWVYVYCIYVMKHTCVVFCAHAILVST